MQGLSVLVPCLNEAAGLARLVAQVQTALRSPLLTEAGPAETILIDDGSQDGTWEAIERVRVGDPRVRAVRHARNRGIPAAWTSGLAVARGEYRPAKIGAAARTTSSTKIETSIRARGLDIRALSLTPPSSHRAKDR